MQHITGMPKEDISRASLLIREMGDFVGKPYDEALVIKAAAAQRTMVSIIQSWDKQFKELKEKTNLVDSVFAFWYVIKPLCGSPRCSPFWLCMTDLCLV